MTCIYTLYVHGHAPAGDAGRVTLKLKDQLTYTSAVVHEAMRVKTVVPIGVPHMTTRDTSLRKAGANNRLLLFQRLNIVIMLS